MAGNRRIVVGAITQGNLRGKAMGDALYRELNDEHTLEVGTINKVIKPAKKKSYGKKK